MKPVVDGIKPKYEGKVEFRNVNFYENRELAQQYRAPGHPTLVVLKADGSVLKVLPGVSSGEAIEAALDEALR